MGDIGKPRRRVIRVPATPIRKPVQEPSPAPKPAPEPVREPARTGYAHDEPGARTSIIRHTGCRRRARRCRRKHTQRLGDGGGI